MAGNLSHPELMPLGKRGGQQLLDQLRRKLPCQGENVRPHSLSDIEISLRERLPVDGNGCEGFIRGIGFN